MFQRTNSTFFKELLKEIDDGKLSNELNLAYGEESIRNDDGSLKTPRINGTTRAIELHETFLSYLWCCVYTVYVTYLETVDYPNVNHKAGKTIYPISEEEIQKARALFEYAKYLIVAYDTWDKTGLPNPEIYQAENRNYVEQTNLFYTEAVKFILCHEFTHLKKHVDQINIETPNSSFLDFEIEADNDAIDMLKSGISYARTPFAYSHRLAVEVGVILGILSMFFFKARTTGIKHPNSEDRLTNALERMGLDNEHYGWGIACVGLKFWDEQFGLQFNWDHELPNSKQQYYHIIEQIKNQQ